MKILLILVCIIAPVISYAEIRIIPPQSAYDSSHDYFSDLLLNVLRITQADYGEESLSYSLPMEQGRAIRELAKGKSIDVYWAGTSVSREEKLGVIRIPLLKGMLGFRVGVIKRNKAHLFKKIDTFDQLKELSACQGSHWPDSDILEASGVRVLRSSVYENMFKQVSFGRCDYFPRGIHEAYVEMAVRDVVYPDLIIFPDLLIYYPFPMYFFVSPTNAELKQRIELGLKRMIERGDFDRFIEEHPTTKHLFPLESWLTRKTFVIGNPLLPLDTDTADDRLWVQPKSE